MGEAPHFFINKKTWHYRYYSWIRKLYLGQKDQKEATSLCPYFHTMLWGTAMAVITSPLLIFSAVGLRILRWILKLNNPFIDWLDSKTPVGDLAKEGRVALEDRPVVGAIMTGIGLLMALFFVLLALGGLVGLVYFSPQIVSGIWEGIVGICWAALYVGWAIFWLAAHVAWALEWTGYGIKEAAVAVAAAVADFFTNGSMWWTVLTTILWIIAGLVSLSIVGLIFWGISKLSFMQRFANWIVMKVNGYEKQRGVREQRLKEKKRIKEEAVQWICSYCNGKNYESYYRTKECYHCGRRNPKYRPTLGERWSEWWNSLNFGTKTIHLPRRPAWVSLGFFSSISAGFWAIKHRVCPALTFVTDEELQQKVREAVASDQNESLAKRAAGIYNDVKCPQCGKELNIAGSIVGETIRCSGCGHVFEVPKPEVTVRKTVADLLKEKQSKAASNEK